MKYTIDATIMVTLEQVPINLTRPASEELDFEDALLQKLNTQLVLLNVKGNREPDDGLISSLECCSIDNWNAE